MTAFLARRAALLLGATLVVGAGTAHADSLKQCSAKYQAAKTAGTLNNQDWKSFRQKECGAADATAPATTPAADAGVAAAPVSEPTAATRASAAAAPAASSGSGGAAVFPSAVNAKYASLTPGKARMKTCLDQYHANKNGGGNGGLKWIQKGGGYYSACSKHLKTK